MRRLQAVGLAYVAYATFGGAPVVHAQTAEESLTLTQPGAPRVVPVMAGDRERFLNYIFWDDHPRSIGGLIHQPDTTGWNASTSTTPQSALSLPTSSGAYLGTIDRTVVFLSRNNGMVGGPTPIIVRYEIRAEEQWANQFNLGAPYVPGDPLDLFFINTLNGDTLDLGIKLSFSTGVVDSNGAMSVCTEDFEGFHLWRGIERDGSDLTVIGELSKEEAFEGVVVDSLFFNDIIPSLRANGRYRFPFPVGGGIPQEIVLDGIHPDGRLGPNELLWFDVNAFNGFTYYYTATTFDKGYDCKSSRQGLEKFDSCPVTIGAEFPCRSSMTSVSTKNTPQDDLQRVYAVPNPYRTGPSRFTTPNYHNFPDNKMRFVNVPPQCFLKVYTPAGDVVWQFTHDGTDGVIEWDVRNSAGNEISSGVYIYRLETPNGDGVFGRIVIIH